MKVCNNWISFAGCLVLLLAASSCSRKVYLKRIDNFFNASATEEKGKYMAEDYRSYFGEKKGEGKDKTSSLQSFLKWDAPLDPDIEILHYTVDKNKWIIELNEQNDFTKPIGFPGWKAKEIITLNSKGFIREAIYIPDPANPSYRKWLQPAVDWLQENMPDSLHDVYQDGRLIQTATTAEEWVRLLNTWHQATAR
jgi:hypothetical protein